MKKVALCAGVLYFEGGWLGLPLFDPVAMQINHGRDVTLPESFGPFPE
jgi:hypothetical protein